MEIGFNARFLIEMLKNLACEEVSLGNVDPKPCRPFITARRRRKRRCADAGNAGDAK